MITVQYSFQCDTCNEMGTYDGGQIKLDEELPKSMLPNGWGKMISGWVETHHCPKCVSRINDSVNLVFNDLRKESKYYDVDPEKTPSQA